MFRFIPHKNKPHNWRTLLFIFFVMIISVVSAYFVHAYPRISQKSVAPSKMDIAEKSEELIVDDTDIIPAVESVPPIITPVEIINPVTAPPIERNKNPETRLQEAKEYARPQISVGKYIDISLKYQNMVIFEDGKIVDAYLISSGKKGFDSPTGTFKIENKSPRAWSKGYGLWMPNWMAILPTGKIGIHELPIWPGGYQEGANHLGTPVSHGCVRLGVGSAKSVFDWAEVGTPVIIHQ